MSKNSDRGMAADILGAVLAGTKKWARTRKQEERSPVTRSYRYARMTQERGVQFKVAAAEIMPEAYAKVSGNGLYPANARQIMYAARPHIQKVTGKVLRDGYFTQTLLPDYLNETGVEWDVVYDSRGHFSEPHGGRVIGLGTLEVRDYLGELHDPKIIGADFSQAEVEVLGPSGSFGAILFVEKEGFELDARQGADRRALRHRRDVDQGHERHCREEARRRNVRRLRHPAFDPARLRQIRIQHRGHPRARHPPLRVSEQLYANPILVFRSKMSRRWGWSSSISTIPKAARR